MTTSNAFDGMLPNDVQLVVKYLPTESAFALALTSKSFFSRLSPRLDIKFKKGNDQERKYWENWRCKRRFLLLLERDFPHLLTCRWCPQLFAWRKREAYQYRCPKNCYETDKWYLKRLPIIEQRDLIFDSCFLNREKIDLTLRYKQLGKEYGISPYSLQSILPRRIAPLFVEDIRILKRVYPDYDECRKELTITNEFDIEMRLDRPIYAQCEEFDKLVCSHEDDALPSAIFSFLRTMLKYRRCQSETAFCPTCTTLYSLEARSWTKTSVTLFLRAVQYFGGHDIPSETRRELRLAYPDSYRSRDLPMSHAELGTVDFNRMRWGYQPIDVDESGHVSRCSG